MGTRLRGGNLGSQLLDLVVEVSQFGAKLFKIHAECSVTICAVEQNPHRIAGQIRDAACAGHRTESSKGGVLLLREADTNHAGTWFQNCHFDLKFRAEAVEWGALREGWVYGSRGEMVARLRSGPGGSGRGVDLRTGFAPVCPMRMGRHTALGA